MIFAEVDAVVCHEVPHPACPVFLFGFDGVCGIGHVALSDGIGEEALLLLRVVETEGGAEIEALEWVEVHVGVAEEAPVGVTVVLVSLEAGYRVLAVGITAHGACELALGGVDGERWIGLEHVLQETAGSLYFVGAVEGEVLAYGEYILIGFELGVDAG